MKNIENSHEQPDMNRRAFLSTVTLGAAAFAASSLLGNNDLPENQAEKNTMTRTAVMNTIRKLVDGHAERDEFQENMKMLNYSTRLEDVGVTEWHFPSLIYELEQELGISFEGVDRKELRENTETVGQLQQKVFTLLS